MNVDDVYVSNSKSLKASDLKGQAHKVKISSYEVKKFEDGSKVILSFEGKEKSLVVNKTNKEIIKDSYGSELDNWIGKELEVYPDKTLYQGDMVACIKVRVPVVLAAPGQETNF